MSTFELCNFTIHDSQHLAFFATFENSLEGGFTTAPGLNATLVANSDGTHTLTFNKTGEVFTFETNGFMTVDQDKNGNKLTFVYNSPGSIDTITDTQGRVLTITHNATGKVTLVSDQTGRAIKYTYDTNDLLTSMTDLYTYDNIGNITRTTDRTGTTTFSYDKDNRETLKTVPGGATITSTYDPVGNLLTLTDSGGTTTYHYNAVNLSDSLTEPGGAQTTFSYNANNSKTSVNYPNGVSMALSYDNGGRETGIVAKNSAGTVLTSYTYSYTNPATNKLTNQRYTMTDTAGNVTKYSYDASNELTTASIFNSANSQTGNDAYSYDANGNRLTAQTALNGPTTTSRYNAANELTSSSVSGGATTSYSYDGNGNQTASSAGLSATYNVANQATTMNGTTNTYSGADQSQRVQSGTTTAVYSQLGLDSEATAAGTTYYIRCSCSALAGERTSSGTYYYLFDGLGSVVGLTDSRGTLVNTYQYDPYGTLTSSTGTVSNPWRYAGGYYDSGTGLYKFGIRYYDPGTGRWTQRDPIGGSLQEMTRANPYVYADNDPVNQVDPSGANTVFGCILNLLVGFGGALFTMASALGVASWATNLLVPLVVNGIISMSAALGVIINIGLFGFIVALAAITLAVAYCVGAA